MESLTQLTPKDVHVPADVPSKMHSEYTKNYLNLTKSTGRVFLFAADQKMEHLNDDFYGDNIPEDALNPEHFFQIASQSPIGAMAAHYGMLSRYGRSYPDVNYIVKLNGKTGIVKKEQREPLSQALVSVEKALALEIDGDLQIAGFGYTIYLGSEFEAQMLTEASTMIHEAHQQGKLAIVWIYPRGKAVPHEFDAHLLAGAAGVAVSLGADFVKINLPQGTEKPAASLKEAAGAAGRTGVIVAGGAAKEPKEYLQQVYDVIHAGGAAGTASGRNIHQRALPEALKLAKATAAIVYENASADEAFKMFSHKDEVAE